VVDVELSAKLSGVFGEALEIFVQLWRFTVLRPKDDLVVNQVKQVVVVESRRWEFLEERLD
jgi:hypothetical protein